MLKRLIAWALTLALVLSAMPLGVLAEGEQVIPAAHSHSATQHDCEHCDGAVTWTPWEKTDSLPKETGHYYLTSDVKPTARTTLPDTADVVLCLNGYTISGEKKSDSLYYLQVTASLTISDCTAYTDEDGVLHAGGFQNCKSGGAMPGAIYAKNNTKLAVYNCIFLNNKQVKNSNSADGKGGVIQMRGDKAGNAPTMHLENVWFENNTSETSAGALCIFGSTTTPVLTAKNCTFKGNSAPNGGAVYLTKTNATFEKCVFTENSYTGSGAGNIQLKGTTTLFDGCTIEKNQGVGSAGSAMYIHGGNSKVTLKDTTVTGNKHTGTGTSSRAAVYVTNNTDKLFLTGKTVVKDNLIATDGTAVERNIFVQNQGNAVDVSGLSNGASVSIWANWTLEETPTFVTAATAPAKWNSAWVISEKNGMAVDYNETDKFHFVENLVHEHCVCGVTGCADASHEKVTFQAWTDDATLPAEGNYYLTEDVDLDGAVSLSKDLVLCLNGHTVTQTKADNRVLTVTGGNVTITGCKGGTVTGGKSTGYGGAITATGSTAHLKLYGITVTGNTAKTNGGGVDIRDKAKLTMSGCKITGNESAKDGGGLYAQKETEVTVTDTEFSGNTVTNGAGGGVAISGKAVLTDLTVKDNQADNGGGMIFQSSSDSVVNGGSVTGNKVTKNGGGIYASKNVTLNGVSVTGNEAVTGGGVYVASTNVLILTGETQIKSNSGTNLYLSGTTNVIFDALSGKAFVSVSVKDNAPRAITGQTEKDPTAYLMSDSGDLQPAFNDGVVYLEAAIKHTHCLCGGEGNGCDHAGVNYAKWDKTDSLPTSGNYYLENDVVLTGEISVTGDLNLCLNGKTVKAAGNKRHLSTVKNQGVTIAISDCTASYAADGSYTAGKFTGGRDVSGNAGGGSMYIRAGSTLKIYDGIFTDNCSYLQGGAVCMADGTVFEMHGGEFSDNRAIGTDGVTWKRGGALAFYGCDATITGGTVKNNKANNGGGIAGYSKAAVTITGGTIEGNWSKADGAGAYANGAGMYISGTAVIKNNESTTAGGNICYGGNSYGSVSDVTVEDGKASSGAGAMVQNGADVTFTNVTFRNNTNSGNTGAIRVYKANLVMTGCTVTGNTAANNAAVSVETSSQLTLDGGSITGNTATDSVGGVKVDSSSQLTLTGAPVIADNAGGNLLLAGGTLMDVSAMTGGEIWISADMGPISKPCSDLSQYFKSESVYRGVVYKDGALYMATDGSHKHCFCLGDSSACDHETVEWVAWESTTSLPSSGSYYLLNDIVLTAEQSISDDVSICLNGHTVTAANGKRHISTIKNSGASIVLCDCTAKTENGVYTAGKLIGGVDKSGNTGGGSIYVRAGCKLELYDGIITGNYSTLVGGAIAFNGASEFIMHGGEISDNKTYVTTVDENGQEVIDWQDGGAIFVTAGNDIKILAGTIKNNEGNGGGGIRFNGTGNLLIAGGVITGNIGHGQGGGVFASKTTVTITGGQIVNNTTTSSAGGLCLGTGAIATMSGGKISGNTASGNGGGAGLYSKAELHMRGGKIANNTSKKDGGGIYANKAGIYLYDGALISGNKVTSGSGGGISYGGSSYGKISGGVIEKNSASAGGGMIIQNQANVEITGGTVSGNSANKSGGGIYTYKATLTMTGGTVKNNTAKTTGAGIAVTSNSKAELSGITVTGNSTKKDGSGIYATSGSVMNIRGGVVAANNYTDGNGGGVCYGSKSSGYVSGISIYGNKTKSGGAGMMIQGGANVTIGYASITGNEAKKTGAGIFVYKAGMTMTGGYIANNTTPASGGGIYATEATNLKLSNVTITKNTAKSGAGIYHLRSKSVLKDCVISENVSTGSGTGLYYTGGTWKAAMAGGEVTNVKIIGNQGGTSCSGAAVYMNNDVEVAFTNCQISDNRSEVYGGGIYAASGAVPTVIGCTFTGNEAVKNGGGLYTGDSGSVIDCYFADNKADKGAGLFAGNYTERWSCNGWGNKRDFEIGVEIQNCTFENNDAMTDGGGFHLDMSAFTKISDCTFTGNTAGVAGAAMWLWENCEMSDLTVTGNVCANNGHAVVLADSEFDGQTYINGLFKMRGDMIIKDNEGGDLFLDYKTTIGTYLDGGYGPKTEMHITLDEGYLTQRVDGAYNYEGGNLQYVLTYGERSITDPEYDPSMVVKPAAEEKTQQKAATGDVLLYAGIGVIALAAIGGAVLLISRKKKSAGAESK